MVKFNKTNLEEVILIEHDEFKDHRGKFIETFNQNLYKKLLPKNFKFLQDDFSYSKKNVLRGFHGEKKIYKIVSCIKGKIQLVIFCNKSNHKDYLSYFKIILSGNDNLQVFVPPMYGIGHQVKSSSAIFHYKQTGYYNPKTQFTFSWRDKRLNIKWGKSKPILSKRDNF